MKVDMSRVLGNLLWIAVCLRGYAVAADSSYLYKVTLVQAAPGKLLELIELYKAKAAADRGAGDDLPLWMRHSQGDHWDLLILLPIRNYRDYYDPERTAKRNQAEQSAKMQEK